jgi:hypothetical protein
MFPTIRAAISIIVVALGSGTPRSVLAQYGYDPAQIDDSATNIYFGSVRDTSGNYISDVSIVLVTEHDEVTYVVVTDGVGRFRTKLPLNVMPRDVTAHCSHSAYKLVRVIKRAPPRGATSPVEIDCILKAISPSG